MNNIILASSSPRRRDILSKFNVPFKVVSSSIHEKIFENDTPFDTAMSLAFQKAQDVEKGFKDGEIIIGADTIVYRDKILGKPKNRDEAIDMLRSLSGKEHIVVTGLAIIKAGGTKKIIDFSKTRVKFRNLTEDKIISYINTCEYEGKAGAYAIQGYGAILVESISGSYSNVVGLPISKLDYLLESHFDIKLL